MKLWTEAARRTLELGRELQRLTPELDKGLLALDGLFRFAAEPAPLRALYLLDRGPELSEGVDVAIRPLSKREGLRILLANISSGACLDSAEAERFLAICARVVAQAPVRLVSYAANFARQEAIYEALRSDLAELSK